jgi:hypothetical protein
VALRPLLLGNIAHDGQDARLTAEVDHRRVDVDGYELAIFGPMPALAAQPAIKLLLFQTVDEAGGEIWIVDIARVHLQQFVAAIAQTPAGGGIDIQDATVEIVNKDRIVDAVEESARPPLQASPPHT